MTVADLIELLRFYPRHAEVFVDGYEGDYDLLFPTAVYIAKLKKKDWCPNYLGLYDADDKGDILGCCLSRPAKTDPVID